MKKFIPIISILLIIYSSSTLAQSCLPEGIIFTTQEQIDNFPFEYPDCTQILGSVEIGDGESWSDINNLEGLSSITYIGGGLLFILNEILLSMEGLNNIDSIGGYLSYEGNFELINMIGFDNLTSVGGIYMHLNGFRNFEGLEGVTKIDGDISLIHNPFIENFIGLDNLITVSGSINLSLESLTSLTGLEGLNYIGGGMGMERMDSISNLNGLNNLSYLGNYLSISDCNNFSSFNGIDNLDTISSLFIYGHNHKAIYLIAS